MYHPLYEYSKAHQAELIRSVTRSTPRRQNTATPGLLWIRSLNFMGDILINLGLRMKHQDRCEAVLLRSRA
jgi:hypothetical protein